MSNLTLVIKRPPMKEPDISNILKTQKEFAEAYEVPVSTAAQELYVKLVEEEHEEWVEEYYSTSGREFDELKELSDVLYVTAGLYYQLGYTKMTALIP